MNKSNILKYYIAHFIYVPLSLIYSLYVGEDIEVLILIFFLSLLTGVLAFGYNYVTTLLGLKLFRFKGLLAFVIPSIVLTLLYVPVNSVIQKLDFGGNYAFLIFLIISSLINISTYIILRLRKS